MASSLASEVGPEAAARIESLAAAAERKRGEGAESVDFSRPLDPADWHMAEAVMPLAGTAEYDALPEPERRRLSRHEAAALLGAGIWFENLLINALARHAYNLAPDDPLLRFLLLELEEECRHSQMFAEYIKRAGTPAYRPSWWLRLQGKYYWLTGSRCVFYLSILGTEEFLHGITEATWRASGTDPVLKALMRLHTVEEQRHMAFAREYLRAAFGRLGALGRWYARLFVPIVVYTVVQASVDPQVYRTLAIPGGFRAAWLNARRRERVRKSLAGYTAFCAEIGVLPRVLRPLWRVLGLLGATR